MNPFSWLGGLFGGAQTSGASTMNLQTIIAIIGVMEAFNVNMGSLTPQQMAAISALMAALGYSVPVMPVAPASAPHA